jgi:putative FmdB family regulatory protein
MPIYEYMCTGCGKTFEIFQKMGDDPLKVCRVCKGNLQKLISNCSFHLKGSGWYATDYRTPAEAAKAAGSSGSAKKPETTEEKTPAPSESTTSSAETSAQSS